MLDKMLVIADRYFTELFSKKFEKKCAKNRL